MNEQQMPDHGPVAEDQASGGNGMPVAQANTTVVYTNDLVGIKPPVFEWESGDLLRKSKKFRRYCELILATPTYDNRRVANLSIISCYGWEHKE